MYIAFERSTAVIFFKVLLFEEGKVQLESVGEPSTLLHLVFGSPKAIMICLWFVLDSFTHS